MAFGTVDFLVDFSPGVLSQGGEIFSVEMDGVNVIHRYNIDGEYLGEYELPPINFEQPTPCLEVFTVDVPPYMVLPPGTHIEPQSKGVFTGQSEIQAEGTGVMKSVEDVIAEIEIALKE